MPTKKLRALFEARRGAESWAGVFLERAQEHRVTKAEIRGDGSQDNREEISDRRREKTTFDDDDHGSEKKEDDELRDDPSGQKVDLEFCLQAESADKKKEDTNSMNHGGSPQSSGLFGVGRDQRTDSQKENDESDEVNDFVNAWVHVCVVVFKRMLER